MCINYVGFCSHSVLKIGQLRHVCEASLYPCTLISLGHVCQVKGHPSGHWFHGRSTLILIS